MNAGCSAQLEYKSSIEQRGPPFRNGHNACARKFKRSSDPNVRPGAATRNRQSELRCAREIARNRDSIKVHCRSVDGTGASSGIACAEECGVHQVNRLVESLFGRVLVLELLHSIDEV